MGIEDIGREIVDSAMKVHSTLGPGLLESAYQGCLCHELREKGLTVDMKLKGCRLGFLLNWNVPLMKSGIKRMVLNL
jgi:PD-(D/E)XK nuclease superfamily protein